mmetsp:Transcript_24317/g.61379  ORF Transcript_24317/g.61379 Transcript_24317/m.61379 type:complete len:333 (-) Transcript_24317:1389-2387(-)
MATQMSHPHDSPLSSIEEIDIKDRPQAHKLEYRRSSKTDRLIEILAMSAKGKKKSGAPQGRRESTRVSISSGECSELAAPRDEVRRNYLATFPSDIINKRKYLAGRNAILEENNKKLRDLAVRFLPKRYFFYFNSIIQIQLHRYNKMLVTINTEQKYALVERVSSFHDAFTLSISFRAWRNQAAKQEKKKKLKTMRHSLSAISTSPHLEPPSPPPRFAHSQSPVSCNEVGENMGKLVPPHGTHPEDGASKIRSRPLPPSLRSSARARRMQQQKLLRQQVELNLDSILQDIEKGDEESHAPNPTPRIFTAREDLALDYLAMKIENESTQKNSE